jgi:calcineurin-like phosphoesterase family protein
VAASTPVRVVCQNTLNWGLARARQRYSIRHTDRIREHVHQARQVLDISVDYYQQFKHVGDELASQRISEARLRRVLDELYPTGTADAATDRTRRSREQTKQRITELFLHGDTQGSAPGSKWAAVNAIVEHADYS